MAAPSRFRTGYLILAVADSAAALVGRRGHRLRWLTKPALMPTLAGYLASSAGHRGAPLRRSALVALGLSTVGDVALLRRGEPSFLIGLGAFLLAHLAYLRGFVITRRHTTQPSTLVRAWPALAVWVVATPTLWRRAGELRVPVAGYTTAIAAMLGASRTLDGAISPRAARRISRGAAVFVLSDALIGAGRFLLAGRHERILDAAVMASYSCGQWLIVDGVAEATQPGSANSLPG